MDTRDLKNKAQIAIKKIDRSAKIRTTRAINSSVREPATSSSFLELIEYSGAIINPIQIEASKEIDAISDATKAESNKREQLQEAVTTSNYNAISCARAYDKSAAQAAYNAYSTARKAIDIAVETASIALHAVVAACTQLQDAADFMFGTVASMTHLAAAAGANEYNNPLYETAASRAADTVGFYTNACRATIEASNTCHKANEATHHASSSFQTAISNFGDSDAAAVIDTTVEAAAAAAVDASNPEGNSVATERLGDNTVLNLTLSPEQRFEMPAVQHRRRLAIRIIRGEAEISSGGYYNGLIQFGERNRDERSYESTHFC